MRYVCKNPPGGGTKPLSAHRLFIQISFPGLFLAMLSHIWMEVGNKLWHEELKIKVEKLLK